MAEEKKRVDQLQEQVQAYLDKRAAEDQQFAEKYANPKKSVAECVKYIYGEAYKRAAGGRCCYIPPEEVYGMAVHYYDEENITISSLPKGASASAASAAKPEQVLTDEERKRAKAEALAEIKAQAKAEAKKKEKARKEAEKARQREKKAAYRRQLEADGDLFATL